MKLGLIVVVAGLVAVGATRTAAKAPAQCGDQRVYGHIASLRRSGSSYRLRFDPALFLTGITANTAAVEDHVIRKGESVPNDYYVVDETHRLYTFVVRTTARVTVLTPKHYLDGEPVSVATLAQLVAGGHPVKLFEPLDSGVWITVKSDTACALAQQYRP